MMRRYTRLSNGFSRKIENHAAAVALTYFAHNFSFGFTVHCGLAPQWPLASLTICGA
jgi:hypothetical protein